MLLGNGVISLLDVAPEGIVLLFKNLGTAADGTRNTAAQGTDNHARESRNRSRGRAGKRAGQGAVEGGSHRLAHRTLHPDRQCSGQARSDFPDHTGGSQSAAQRFPERRGQESAVSIGPILQFPCLVIRLPHGLLGLLRLFSIGFGSIRQSRVLFPQLLKTDLIGFITRFLEGFCRLVHGPLYIQSLRCRFGGLLVEIGIPLSQGVHPVLQQLKFLGDALGRAGNALEFSGDVIVHLHDDGNGIRHWRLLLN